MGTKISEQQNYPQRQYQECKQIQKQEQKQSLVGRFRLRAQPKASQGQACTPVAGPLKLYVYLGPD